MIYELILVATWPFWLFFALFFISEMAAVENERVDLSAVALIVFVLVVILFTNLNVFEWIFAHPLQLLTIIVSYLIAGVLWSLAKWYFYALNQRDKLQAIYDKYVKEKPASSDKPMSFQDYVKDRYYSIAPASIKFTDTGSPYIAADKTLIVLWMAYWPMSALWTLVNDPLRRFYNFMYNRLVSVYTAIANHVMRKFVVVKEEPRQVPPPSEPIR